MATFRFGVNNRPTKSKTYVVFLCVTVDGQRKHIKTSVEVKRRSDFNSKAKQNNWIRPSEPNYKAWNTALAAELEKARQTYRDLRESGIATSEKVASEIIAGERTTSFLQYAKERTQEIYNAGGFRNWKKYNGFINKLEGFLTGKDGRVKDLAFGELTPALLSKFEAYMHTLKNERDPEKKLHPNTIKVNFTIFRSIVNRAVEVDGHIKPEKNPFLGYSYKGVPTTKEKLNMDEIKVVEGLELEPGSMLWHVRNYFLFSFYCAGIRAGDLIQLRWGNITSDGRLRYQMGKNHKPSDFILVTPAREILTHYRRDDSKQTDYIFPLLDSSAPYAKAITQEDKDTLPPELKIKLFNQIAAKNALINKYLRKLTEAAGIEKKVSFHISRHSFAKVAKQKGVDNANLKNLLRHHSLKVTEVYMDNFDTSDDDKALEAMFATPQQADDPKVELLALLDKMNPDRIAALVNELKQ
ncbi:site-specific integrase [Alistipes sp. OttesenSCG-928-B03]|nr:site-specific integrase [Alistipes sp. OttesenSCG-928-B03]